MASNKRKWNADGNEFNNADISKRMKNSKVNDELNKCVVCLENDCSVSFRPCRHSEFCHTCAHKLTRCPVCKGEITSKLVGLSPICDVNSAIFESSVIVGRAIFTADHFDIFSQKYAQLMKSINNDNKDDKMHLWAPQFCHDVSRLQFDLPSKVSAIIILEGLYTVGISQTQSSPIGVLVLRSQVFERKSILLQSFITKADLKNGVCEIIWFSPVELIRFSNKLFRCDTFSWSHLLSSAMVLLKLDKKVSGERSCASVYALTTDTNYLASTLHDWLEKYGRQSSSALPKEMNGRVPTPLERIWLAIHFFCRVNKRTHFHGDLFIKSLHNLTVHTEAIDPHMAIDKLDHTLAKKCNIISLQDDTTDQLLSGLQQLIRQFALSKKTYKENMSQHLQSFRQNHANFHIYVGYESDKMIQQCISGAPIDPFMHSKVKQWSVNQGKELSLKVSPGFFYHKIFGDIVPIVSTCRPFILYDMIDNNINSLCEEIYRQKAEDGFEVQFKPHKSRRSCFKIFSGNLSNPCTFKQGGRTVNSSVRKKILSQFMCKRETLQKLLSSAFNRTPVWCTHRSNVRRFHYLQHLPDKGSHVADILETNMYPSNGSNLYTHEVVNFHMHISTIIFDIDVKPVKNITSILVSDFLTDLVKLTEMVLERLDLGNRCTHYVFQSQHDYTEDVLPDKIDFVPNRKNKFGFHHHVRLPHDTVVSVRVCKQMVNILNDARFMFPDTLGVAVVGDSHEIFDSAIYNEKSFHSIRGPNQAKHDGTAKLVCVFRTDGKDRTADIPLQHKMVHAPHIDPTTQNYVNCGRVVEKLTNINLIRNNLFLPDITESNMNRYAKLTCKTDVRGLMSEINMRCVLFTNQATGKDVGRLEDISNELWKTAKHEIVRRMQGAMRTDLCTYSKEEVDMLKSTVLKHNPATNNLSLCFRSQYSRALVFKLPFCLRKCHTNPVTNTVTWIGYDHEMIHLGLFTHCFKQSCHGKHFMSAGHMKFLFPFYSPAIETLISRYIAVLNRSDPKMFVIRESDKGLATMHVNTNVKKCSDYLSSAQSIHQLYAFVDDKAGYSLLCVTNTVWYIFVTMPQVVADKYVFSKNTPELCHIQQQCEVFVHPKDPSPLMKVLEQSEKVSQSLHRNLMSIFQLEKNISDGPRKK